MARKHIFRALKYRVGAQTGCMGEPHMKFLEADIGPLPTLGALGISLLRSCIAAIEYGPSIRHAHIG